MWVVPGQMWRGPGPDVARSLPVQARMVAAAVGLPDVLRTRAADGRLLNQAHVGGAIYTGTGTGTGTGTQTHTQTHTHTHTHTYVHI